MAPATGDAVEPRLAPGPVRAPRDLIAPLGDDRLHPVSAQLRADAGVAVALVAREGRGRAARPARRAARNAGGVGDLRGEPAFVRLAGAQRHGEREPGAASDEVQLACGDPW